jgi:SOS-response transcriptional repressor LexA
MEETKIKTLAKELQLTHSMQIGAVAFHGDSMLPFLKDGDDLVVEPADWIKIRPGDIVTYRDSDKFPTYRVQKKTGDTLWLKGDNWLDSFHVHRVDVLGKVVERQRGNSSMSYKSWKWRVCSCYILFRELTRKVELKARHYVRKVTTIV